MPPPLDVELQLRRHGDALRSLAAQLLRGPAVEDAMQEVWLAALREPPRDGASIGGWLRTVLLHVVSRWRRQHTRREKHERRAVRLDTVEDHTAALAREEAGHHLLTAVGALEPPYRDAIWQRFFEGKAPREIAAASGVPIATVKSRLQRGLGMLRERLGKDADGGDWRAQFAVAFGFGQEGTAAAAALATGGVLMATWTKVTLGAIAAAAAVAMWSWWPDANAPAPSVAGKQEATSVAGAVSSERAAPAAGVAPRTDAAPERAAVPERAPNERLATIRGRCVDENGAPLAGCAVTVAGWERNGEDTAAWLVDHASIDWTDPPAQTTGSDGAFAFAFAPPAPLQFRLDLAREGFVRLMARWTHVGTSQAIDVGDVVMSAGVPVRGRVIDSAGQPQAGVRLAFDAGARANQERPAPLSGFSTATGRDGTLASAEPQMPGVWRVAPSLTFRLRSPQQITLVAGVDTVHEFVVDPVPESEIIRGTVVDAAGVPVPNAFVHARTLPSAWGTARDGTFTLVATEGDKDELVHLRVQAKGHEAVEQEVRWGSSGVVLRLGATAQVQVRVVDGTGAPIEAFTVRLASVAGEQTFRASGPSGIAQCDGVERGRYDLVVEFPAAAALPAIFDRVEVTGAKQVVALRSVVAQRTLRVATADGEPVAGTRVQLCEMRGSTFERAIVVLPRGKWSGREGPGRAFVLQDLVTGADGRCELAAAPARAFGLRVLGPGHAPLDLDDVRLDVEGELAVTVARGGTLRGRIVPATAVAELARIAAEAKAAGFEHVQVVPKLLLQRGTTSFPRWVVGDDDPASESARVRADGTFVLPDVPAGEWRVDVTTMQLMKGERGGIGKTWRGPQVVVRDGETVAVDVDLQRVLPSRLRGAVVWNGTPLANAKIGVEARELDARTGEETGATYWNLQTDGHGAFEYEGTADRVEVSMHSGPDQSALACLLLATGHATLRPGETTEHTFHVASGTLRLCVVDAAGNAVGGLRVRLGENQETPPTGADGRLEVPATAGTLTLSVPPKSQSSDRARRQALQHVWIQCGTATVVAGGTAEVELRLPPEWEK